MIRAGCAQHPVPAGWQCTVCKRLLCPDCTATKIVGATGTELELCTVCGELAAPLKISRSQSRSFLRRLLSVPSYVLAKGNLLMVVAIALAFTLARYYLVPGYVLTLASGWSTLFVLVRSSARG